MKFPAIGDIATVSVISLDIEDTLEHAVEMMIQHEHRSVVVVDGYDYSLLSVLDIVKEQGNDVNLNTRLKDLNLQKIPVIAKYKNILDALELLNDKSEHICVVNEDKTLYGFVSQSDITANIDPDTLMDNYRLRDFLKIGRKLKIVNKEESTHVVLNMMASESLDYVLVAQNKNPIGILTTKDIMSLLKSKKDINLPISNYMSSPVESIKNTSSIREALEYIKSKSYNRVVVVDNNEHISGVVSQKELIALTYSRWVVLMKEYQQELSEINALLENKNKEYEVLATKDSLTGLYNRYKFSQLYITAYKSMIQRESQLSFLILDIDYFKNVNDTFGHNAGDDALVQVAHTILRVLRNIDIVARWGGEEFVALLPTVNLTQALKISQKIRTSIEEIELDIVGKLTVSIGVSEVKEGDSMNDVVNRADKALYLAKKSGRNCVKTELDI